MYFTLLNNLIEILLDAGFNGFQFYLWFGGFTVISIDTSYMIIVSTGIVATLLLTLKKIRI